MARNVEIKARARDFPEQAKLAQRLGNGEPEHFFQEDTFFNVPVGRLKLRVFTNGRGELIQYQRDDSLGPAESRYVLAPTNNPEKLKEALANALGIYAVVTKKRTVHFVDQARIHLDQVEALGAFIELEVALKHDEPLAHGVMVAEKLMAQLGIEKGDLVATAYVDLLSDRALRQVP